MRAEIYRLRALVSERLARDATDKAIQAAWNEIAIEWHVLSSLADGHSLDGIKLVDLEVS
jgi:hypothetical protein